jgi:hypothetical protein
LNPSSSLNFSSILNRSWSVFRLNFKAWLPYILFLCAISVSTIWGLSHLSEQQEMTKFLIILLEGMISLWVSASLFLQFWKKHAGEPLDSFSQGLWEGASLTPIFLLYSLLLGLAIMAGGILLIIPGLYIMVVYYFVPYLSIIDEEGSEGPFKESRKLVQGHFLLTTFVLIFSFMIAGATMWTDLLFSGNQLLTIDLILAPVSSALFILSEFFVLSYMFALKENCPASNHN